MRIHRIVAAAVALTLLGLLPVAIGSAASASVSAASADRAEPSPAAQARRKIEVQGLEPKPNRFFIKGKVEPDYQKKKVFMLKKVGTGSYKKANKFKTDKRSRFKVRVAGPPRGARKVCYRAMIPAGNGFKKSQSKALCIVRL